MWLMDTMQCVTCNIISLFISKLKSLIFPFEAIFFSKCFWSETLIHSCMKLGREQHCNPTSIELKINLISIQQLIWDSIKDKWNTNWWEKYWKSSYQYDV
jgi:hypothetical protein